MLYFSLLINKKIFDKNGKFIGKLKDIAIQNKPKQEFAKMTGLLLKQNIYISDFSVTSWQAKKIIINKEYSKTVQKIAPKDIVYLGKTVIDKQIVDINGMRVVRANDLQFDIIDKTLCLITIDISNCGLIRRLGIHTKTIEKFCKPNFIAWKDVKLTENQLHLSTVAKKIVRLHPADIANYIEKMTVHQGSKLLQSLDKATATRVIEEIEPGLRKVLIKNLGPERAANILHKMSTDDLVDLIQLLPKIEAEEIIAQLPTAGKKQSIAKILEYDEDTAGGLMNTEFISAGYKETVAQMIQQIKKISADYRSILFIYILDENKKFSGVVSLRTLLISAPEKTMGELVKKDRHLPTVQIDQSLLSIARFMTKYNLFSAAVLDKDGYIAGVITVDDIMRGLLPDA